MSGVEARVCPHCRSAGSATPTVATIGIPQAGSWQPSDDAFWDQPTHVVPQASASGRCPACGRKWPPQDQALDSQAQDQTGNLQNRRDSLLDGAQVGSASVDQHPQNEGRTNHPTHQMDWSIRDEPIGNGCSSRAGASNASKNSWSQRSGIPGEDDNAGVRTEGAARHPDRSARPPIQVPGYVIEGVIGSGGMGTVYLARQLSLDRHVALKVMSRRWLHDPVFLARFTREAYAAAQLSHPNIVQIYDIGEAEGVPFFSMEYVRGRSLSEVVRRHGRLDPATAVGYVLQAARGLQHAHSRGLIHRDVKPDNLLLDEQGLIKVADLGLVKTPHGELTPRTPHPRGPDSTEWAASPDVTGTQVALGTPAYMSPEQCRDAASVDHRSDIYSLGCTLYVLLTGRPPFEGRSAVELMSKHAYEPPPPPEQWVPRLPRELSTILLRMLAKDPNQRYQSMEEVIEALERWLGLPPQGQFVPRPEQVDQVEGWSRQFHRSPAARRRRRVLTASLTAWAVTGLLLLFFATPPWTAGWLSLLLHTTLGYGIIQGVTVRGPLFCRLRHCLRQICHSDWLLAGVGMLLFCVLLTILGVVWLWWGFALIGLGLGGLLHVLLDRPVLEERRRPVEACARLLRRLRNQGIAEEQLRLFVARYAGRHWEEFFEALFGYEAKLEVRNRLGATACSAQRERHAAWREPLIAWLDRWEAQRQMLRERRWLTRVEQARLLADGNQAEVAAVKAQQAAEALIQRAGQLRAAEQPWRSSLHLSPGLSSQSLFGSSLFWGSMPGSASSSTAPSRLNWSDRLLTLLLGTSTRCLLAACLLAAFALWACQNARGILQTTPSANSATGHALSQTQRDVDHIWEYLMLPTEPLQLPPLPSRYTAWINGWNIGVAAMLLLVSLFYRGHVMGLFVLLGVLVTAFGAHYGIRTAEPLRPEHTALILGTTLTLIGLRCARTT